MAEGTIYVGTRLRVELPAVDLTPEGEMPFKPESLTATIIKPDGTELHGWPIGWTDNEPHVDFEPDEEAVGGDGAGDLDQPGVWRVHANEGGYKARISFRVYP